MVSLGSLASKLFGSSNERKIKPYQDRVELINALESDMEALNDNQIKAKTDEYRQRITDGAKLDDILVEAFAVVREAAKRTLGQRHFDVQLIGGMVLHEGNIAEMKTGEGKTLVATLAAYLNALEGKGVHVVTVNDYLAKRDASWMGQIYEFLGLSVGCIVHEIDEDERQKNYACDVTYGTNNEFGFDYLRDNLKFQINQMAQRGHNFVIVDEVDSILIDEARTPLIISGAVEDKTDLYITIDKFIPLLEEDDYEIDEKTRTASLSEKGNETVEKLLIEADLLVTLPLYDAANVSIVHHVNQALKAHKVFKRDVDYIVKHSQVVIIDEFTGRMMEGRRFSDGLHQALEAKEDCQIQSENQTLASVTFQNYFRLYEKMSGMTGTALTEAEEFMDIYKLGVIEMPTNLPVKRIDDDDEIYRTAQEKYNAIVDEVIACYDKKQPVLVGTTSIEKSELISEVLKKKKIKHNVLNARYHDQEASIIALAGEPSAVTIATNMAGRGTDIQLGGNYDMRVMQEANDIEDEKKKQRAIDKIKTEIDERREIVREAGGLYIIGSERHESRRIDNQLRGRSGRQGDPGRSRFFLSLEDDLMRIFGSDRLDGMLQKFGIEEGEAIKHNWINKALEKAQSKVEARNFDARKNVLKFDDVTNVQRKVIFEQRIEFMHGDTIENTIKEMRENLIGDIIDEFMPPNTYPDQWNIEGMKEKCDGVFVIDIPIEEWAQKEGVDQQALEDMLNNVVAETLSKKVTIIGPDNMRDLEKAILLQTLDQEWRDHLTMLEHLRQYVGLRGYGQRDPLNEYKSEAFELFQALLTRLQEQVLKHLMAFDAENAFIVPEIEEPSLDQLEASHDEMSQFSSGAEARNGQGDAQGGLDNQPLVSRKSAETLDKNDPSTWGKVARNAPCPCGSGKKYKFCHGRI